MVEISVIVNDFPLPDFRPEQGFTLEHGLSLLIRAGSRTIVLDTGAGNALGGNLDKAEIDLPSDTLLIFSHGHYDHTGGLTEFLCRCPDTNVYYAPGLDVIRYSIRENEPIRTISMPSDCLNCFRRIPERQRHVISEFTPVDDLFYLTGPIPRISGEDCGGPFYLDSAGKIPDLISDEQAILFLDGTLVVGCCHAGIINTVEYCRRVHPEITIRKIVGGLHLINADTRRMEQTQSYLNSLKLEQLELLHCTGDLFRKLYQ